MNTVDTKIKLLTDSVAAVFSKTDEEFLATIAGIKEENYANVLPFKEWDWFQGVGLYGYWKSYELTKDSVYLDFLVDYFDKNIKKGLPYKTINSVAPLLTLSYVYDIYPKEEYMSIMKEWAAWIVNDLVKTDEGGFAHMTGESKNEGQLWDDTLFMTVLFLARAGILLDNKEYIEEAKYQFMLHIKYLVDRDTGLWYHGWNFLEKHNYAKALWARGNCWITIAIPELIEMLNMENDAVKRFLTEALRRQIEAVAKYQHENGLWYTIVNEDDNYLEASGSAGFAYGILRAVSLGLVDEKYVEVALKPYNTLLELVDESGTVGSVSIGTPMGMDVQFYKEIKTAPMAYGQSLTLLYLIEAKAKMAK